MRPSLRVILEGVRIAYRALLANKLRTFLTLLGNIVGIMSVIAVVSPPGRHRPVHADRSRVRRQQRVQHRTRQLLRRHRRLRKICRQGDAQPRPHARGRHRAPRDPAAVRLRERAGGDRRGQCVRSGQECRRQRGRLRRLLPVRERHSAVAGATRDRDRRPRERPGGAVGVGRVHEPLGAARTRRQHGAHRQSPLPRGRCGRATRQGAGAKSRPLRDRAARCVPQGVRSQPVGRDPNCRRRYPRPARRHGRGDGRDAHSPRTPSPRGQRLRGVVQRAAHQFVEIDQPRHHGGPGGAGGCVHAGGRHRAHEYHDCLGHRTPREVGLRRRWERRRGRSCGNSWSSRRHCRCSAA